MIWFLCTLLALLHQGQAQTVNDCPLSVPRDQYLQVYNGVCYQFSIKRWNSYFDAIRYCTGHGGTLVIIKNRELNGYLWGELRKFQTNKQVWIGLSDSNSEGKHVWMDGTVAEYTNWALAEGGQHSIIGGAEDCVTMDPMIGGQWRDVECKAGFLFGTDERRPFICQYQPVIRPTQLMNSTTATTPSNAPNSTTPNITNAPNATTPMVTPRLNLTTPATNMTTSISNLTTSSFNVTTPASNLTSPTSTITTQQASSLSTAMTGVNTTSTSTSSLTTSQNSTTAAATPVTPNASTGASTSVSPSPSVPISSTLQNSANTTTQSTIRANVNTCPPFTCALDCGLIGYKTDANNCSLCECDF